MIEKKEFIGKEAKITYAGKVFTGKIIDETKNTFLIKIGNKQKNSDDNKTKRKNQNS